MERMDRKEKKTMMPKKSKKKGKRPSTSGDAPAKRGAPALGWRGELYNNNPNKEMLCKGAGVPWAPLGHFLNTLLLWKSSAAEHGIPVLRWAPMLIKY